MISKLWEEYGKKAIKTQADLDVESLFKYNTLKLISELGEVLGELVKLEFHSESKNTEKLIDELGDCFWYINAIYSNNDIKMKKKVDIYLPLYSSLIVTSMDRACKLAQINPRYSMQYDKKEILDDIFSRLMVVIDINRLSFKEILEHNLEKIEKRHGTHYNGKNFYEK